MAALHDISLPEDLFAAMKHAAEAEQRSVDDVLADAVRRYLDEHSWQELFAYGAERAKSLGLQDADVDRLIAESRANHRGQ
ncbi:MAG: hypothetical protein IT165_35330 [Bryobacterales bacterium]|nr:hypothetical protein [Bryobacterales bacterium]